MINNVQRLCVQVNDGLNGKVSIGIVFADSPIAAARSFILDRGGFCDGSWVQVFRPDTAELLLAEVSQAWVFDGLR